MHLLHAFIFLMHLAALGLAACGVLYADKIGFAWIRGERKTIPKRTLHILHEVVSFSLMLLILSGLYLFWPSREFLLTNSLFWIKMGFVAALVINSLVIDSFMEVAARVPFDALTTKGKLALLTSGTFSFASWVGAGITALLLFGL